MAINYKGGRRLRSSGNGKSTLIKVGAGVVAGGVVLGAASIIGTVVKNNKLETEVNVVGNQNIVLSMRNEFLSGELDGKEFEAINRLEDQSVILNVNDSISAEEKEKIAEDIENLQRDLCAKYLSSALNELYNEGYIKESEITHEDFSTEQIVTYTDVKTGKSVAIEREDEDTTAVIITTTDGKGNLTTSEYDSNGGLRKLSATLMTQEESIEAYRQQLREDLESCVVTRDNKGNLVIVKNVELKSGNVQQHYQLITMGDKGEIQEKLYIDGEMYSTKITSASDRYSFEEAGKKANKTAIQFQSINAKG
ncbi:MAG: hypothetical protein ACLRFG_00350 [Clostridia bacterium]